MKKRVSARMLAPVMALLLLAEVACAEGGITSKAMLNAPGRRIGVSQGSAAEAAVISEMPEATIEYYTDYMLGYTSVAQGKLDAFVADSVQMQLTIDNGLAGVRLLPEFMDDTVKIAVGYSAVSAIPDLGDTLNRFIAEVKSDGTLDDMYRRWVLEGNSAMPEISLTENPKVYLTVGTTGIVPPYSYYEDGSLTGYDIELARRFAAWLDADLSFQVFDFNGVVPALKAGKVDVVMSNLQYLPERAEEMPFSDILYEEKFGIMVQSDGSTTDAAPAYSAYNGKRIGVLTGPLMEDAAKEFFPDSEYLIFNSYPDCITALLTGKIDAYLGDELGVKTVHMEQPDIDYIRERITENNYSFAFRKNDPDSAALCAELNAFLAKCWSDGTMDALDDIWFGEDEDRKVVDMSDLTGENGTIKVVTTSTDAPFSYIKDGRNVGYDIDLVVRFCRDRGYALELGDVDFAGRIPAIESGKYDFTTDMNVTPEREEEVLFSDPVCKGGIVLAVRKGDAAASTQENVITSIAQLNDPNIKLGLPLSSAADEAVREQMPLAQLVHYNDNLLGFMDVAQGRIDAYVYDEVQIKLAMENGVTGVRMLDEFMDKQLKICVGISPVSQIPDLEGKVNRFIAEMKEDGMIDDMLRRWVWDAERTLPEIELPADPQYHLVVGTSGIVMPFSYYEGEVLTGMDIEMAYRFAQWLGADLEFQVYDYGAIVPAAVSGKVDVIMANLQYSDERAESGLIFSDQLYAGRNGILVRDKATEVMTEGAKTASATQVAYTSLSELENSRIGVATGSVQALQVEARFPEAELYYFSNSVDMLNALRAHKIDAYADAEPFVKYMMAENPDLTYLDEWLADGMQVGSIFPMTDEGEALRDTFNAFIREIRQNGVYDEIQDTWFGPDESKRVVPDLYALTPTNGTLRMATDTSLVPFVYIKDGKPVGIEIDTVVRFCKAYGYGLEVVPMDFAGIIPSVVTGKVDFASSCIAYTPERAQSVLYSEPTYESGSVIAVLKVEEATLPTEESPSFWDGIAASFNKTFLRENRWKLFIQGIGTTLLITLLTILFGTALGFIVFMLCRNGNPFANAVTRFCMWLVQGMPMVVLLMILYYVIFGSVAISGIAVAVLGFTLTFGAAVFGLLKLGVGTVDRGQYEAAYALGHSNRRTFFKIILPQAIPHILPAYKGEIVGLIKATAIVGYIAVQDLTKMGDIVRSRTYEAFFPLIAVTVIYFVLEGLLGFLVSRIRLKIDPKRRSRETILKGVNTHD